MTLVSLVTLYLILMAVPYILCIVIMYKVSNLLSAFTTLSYAHMVVLSSSLWYINSDELDFMFGFTSHYLTLGATSVR